MRRRGNLAHAVFVLILLAASACGQDLPPKIRGYRVHQTHISVAQNSDREGPVRDVSVMLGEPAVKEVSPAGVTLDIPITLKTARQSGTVDFLTFYGLRVQGLAVQVEEYRHPFAIRNGETSTLPVPARVFVPTAQLLKVAYREINGPKKAWTVSGRLFIFGKFRKFGLEHKRVIPIDFTLEIKNSAESLTSPAIGLGASAAPCAYLLGVFEIRLKITLSRLKLRLYKQSCERYDK